MSSEFQQLPESQSDQSVKINEMINIHIMLVTLFPKEFNSAQLLKKLHNYLLLNLFVLTACEHKYMITTLPLIIGPDVVNK